MRDLILKNFSSPHCDDRPEPNDINLLVIHCISLPEKQFLPSHQPFESSLIHQLFMEQHSFPLKKYFDKSKNQFPNGIPKVSAHIVIRREKDEIFQYVPFEKRAWHAGKSEFEGRANCNDFSIGIELEGYSENISYTDRQYERLAEITRLIIQAYPKITKNRIVGHSDIARPVGRKSDPGRLFNWDYYRGLLFPSGRNKGSN
ncbi:MAG: 1,6-anhydro-N-acetylmuramyl-L-alanine amidase AmpD [Gammaproteobacteria bacterium]